MQFLDTLNIFYLFIPAEKEGVSDEDDDSGNSCTIGSEIYFDVSYLHYLYDARLGVSSCIRGSRVWSARYDGEDPPPEKYQAGVLEEPSLGGRQTQMVAKRVPQKLAPRPQTVPPPKTEPPSVNLQELEWDDSYDACPVQTADAPVERTPPQPPSAEPPKHIQEMRRTAIMFIKGSYIEESEFQDDVMVYDLVAKKDAGAAERGRSTESEEPQPGPTEAPLNNGLSVTPPSSLITDGKNTLDIKTKGQTNSNLQGGAAPDQGDDLLAQYEELIRTFDTEAGGKTLKSDGELKKPITPLEEEEEMDFATFSAGTPEPEKLPSPFGGAFRSGSISSSNSVPFTGEPGIPAQPRNSPNNSDSIKYL